jgi:O-antigen ligase
MTQVSTQPESGKIPIQKRAEIYFFTGVYLLIAGTIFPTFRAMLIGHEGASSIYEYIVSAIPDIAILVYTAGSFALRLNLGRPASFPLLLADKILLFASLYAVLVGSFLSADFKYIIYGLRMSYIPILMYLAIRNLQEFLDEQVYLKGLSIFMHWLFITSIIGLLLYFPFSELEQKLKTIVHASRSSYHIPRLNSIYHAPTLNGAYMSIAAAYFSIRFLQKVNYKTAIILSLVLINLLLSVSRGGILAYIIILPGVIYLMRKWKSSLILAGIIVVSVIAGLRAVNLSPDKAGWIFKSSAGTLKMDKTQTRVKLWDSTYSTLERHPFGLGLGKSGWVANRFVKESNEETAFSATDGWYLKTANEIGIPGLLFFMIFFAFLGWSLYRNSNFLEPGISFYIMILFIQVMLLNIVSNTLDYFVFNSFFWMCTAISMSGGIKIKKIIKK